MNTSEGIAIPDEIEPVHSRHALDIAVVGGGIIGLNVSLLALRTGHRVINYSDGEPVSLKAGASVKPCDVALNLLTEELLDASMTQYIELASTHPQEETGIRLDTHIEGSDDPKQSEPWYLGRMRRVRELRHPEVPGGYAVAWEYETGIINTRVHMRWLRQQIEQLGGKFVTRRVIDLAELTSLPADIVIN